MALPYNPNANGVFGIETSLIRSGRTNLSDYSSGVCQAIKALVSEVTEWAVLPMPVQDPYTEFDRVGPFAVDVYAADPLDSVAATRGEYLPNAFTDRVGWVDQAGATASLNARIDEDPDAPDYTDYIIDTSIGSTHKVDFQFGTAAFPASQRIYDVRVKARVRGGNIGFQMVESGSGGSSQKVTTGYTGVVGTTGYRTVELSFGERCPWTQKPWTSTDIALFDSTAEIRVSREDSAVGFYSPTIAALQLVVLYGTERRAARGIVDSVLGLASDAEFCYVRLYTPSGGDWAKNATTTYFVVVRRARLEQNPIIIGETVPPRENFDVHWVEPAADADTNETFPQAFTVTTGSGGRVTAKGTTSNRRYAVTFNANAAAPDLTLFPTTDSQPYGFVGALDLSVAYVRQRFLAPASANYASVRLCVVPGPVGDESATTVLIRRVSDNVQIGGTITLTRETVTEQGTFLGTGSQGDVWQVQGVLSAAAALVSGTAYYLEVSGGALSVVYVDGPHNGLAETDPLWPYEQDSSAAAVFLGNFLGEVTFGAQTGRLITTAGTVDRYAGDVLFVLGQQPASLQNFVVDDETQILTTATPDTDTCETIDTLPLAKLSWTASALAAADFEAYEVERYDPVTGVWTTIARLTSQVATTWYDPDIRFGVREAYRVRQIRTGGVPSDYTGDTTTNLLLDAPGCGLYFTVAEDQEWNMAALDTYGSGPADRDFQFLNDKVLVPMIGRDYQVAFAPSEERGSTFTRTVLLNAISSLTVPTFETFDPLRDLAKADVSAVCVRDHEGNRWYCSLVVPSGKLRKSGELAWAQVQMTEVAAGPVAYVGRGQSLGGS